jgi:hypothetical protein
MSQQELLKLVTMVLERRRIEYMLTGSVASSAQGEPRASHDIDLVVAMPEPAVDALCDEFPPPEYYLSRDAVREAVRRRSMFNLLCVDSGDKVDFWLLTDEPFDRSRFSRRVPRELFGVRLWMSSPEDTILAKLRWCRISGGSEKQYTDALRVYEVQRDGLDNAYIETWAARLDVGDLWMQLRERGGSDQ